jgi:hypothetical protein
MERVRPRRVVATIGGSPTTSGRGERGSYLRCATITKGGSHCKLPATHGPYCRQHAPEFADERRRDARRGGRIAGRGRPLTELREVKHRLLQLAEQVLDGDLDRANVVAAGQLYNTALRALEVERRWREQDELLERIEALEAAEASERQGTSWRR